MRNSAAVFRQETVSQTAWIAEGQTVTVYGEAEHVCSIFVVLLSDGLRSIVPRKMLGVCLWLSQRNPSGVSRAQPTCLPQCARMLWGRFPGINYWPPRTRPCAIRLRALSRLTHQSSRTGSRPSPALLPILLLA